MCPGVVGSVMDAAPPPTRLTPDVTRVVEGARDFGVPLDCSIANSDRVCSDNNYIATYVQ